VPASTRDLFAASGYKMLRVTIALPAGKLPAKQSVTGRSHLTLEAFRAEGLASPPQGAVAQVGIARRRGGIACDRVVRTRTGWGRSS
jgi:hypothetical protein